MESLTPITIVASQSLEGAEIMTFFAPAARCSAALARSVKSPVDSMTSETPSSFHGSFEGSFSLSTRVVRPSTMMFDSSWLIAAFMMLAFLSGSFTKMPRPPEADEPIDIAGNLTDEERTAMLAAHETHDANEDGNGISAADE